MKTTVLYEIMSYIKDYILEHQYAPSVKEITEAVGLKSTSTTQHHLEHLIELGLLETDTKPRQPRALRLPSLSIEEIDKTDWIPCKNALPEEAINPITQDFYEYEVTYRSDDIRDVRHYKFGNGHWWHGPQIMDQSVTAWKRRSKPYI